MTLDLYVLLTVGTIALAGLVQSVTGFGFGLLSMALLPLFLDFREAYFIIVIPNLLVCVAVFWANRRHYRWRQGTGLLIGSCVATPIGFYTMANLRADWLMLGLGVVVCLFSLSELVFRARPLKLSESWSWPMGLCSGCLGGAFNIGGPPAVLYAYSQPWPKEQIVALLQLVFGTASALRLVLGAGMVSGRTVWISLLATLPLLLAVFVGNRVLRMIHREQLRLIVVVLLFVLGVKYVASAFLG